VKFTEAGHVRVSIRGGAGDGVDGDRPLVLAVEDTGIGIAPEMQSHVFGEFNQAEDQTNRSRDGTGLGLAITRRLIDLMEGEIALVSEPGRGSTFTVTLPLRRPPGAPHAGAPRLSPGGRDVRLIGPLFSDRARRLIARLAALGARIRAAPHADRDDPPRDGEIVILLHDGPDATAALAEVRSAGFAGRCLHLRDVGVRGTRTPGLEVLRIPETATGLADLLERPARKTAPSPAGGARRRKARKPPRISLLAAEDNRTNQLVFRTMLKGLDLDLRLVENGADLVEAYRRAPPDLVFSDISMPGMDGLEATGLIRAHEAATGLPRTPIIAMTAHAGQGERERFLQAGMDDYLTKPLKKAELLAFIDAAGARGLRAS
jgi:CheY-like chemotaxis protein